MKKPFIVANVREITDKLDRGEITYSRMVEMLNEIAEKFYDGKASPGEGAVIVEGVESTPKTIGQLLTEAFTLNELKADVVEKELDFPAGIITKLMNDDYYTNSVPVVLFKNLILSLHIKPSDVYRAMVPTHKIVIAKETPETIRRKSHGYQLWENEEAVIKYTAHLKSIITTGEPLTLPDNSTDILMGALRKSEIN